MKIQDLVKCMILIFCPINLSCIYANETTTSTLTTTIEPGIS